MQKKAQSYINNKNKWNYMNLNYVKKLIGGIGTQLYAIRTDFSVHRYDSENNIWYPFIPASKGIN